MSTIFVSYSSKDASRVEALVAALQGTGHAVWWDLELRGGTRFADEIERQVEGAECVLVVWSENSVRSRWVADEADLALQSGKLVPVSLDGVRPPIGFRQIQTIDFSRWRGSETEPAFQQLDKTLGEDISPVAVGSALKEQALSRHDASIAVLPFVNMSADPEQEFFADGISEELLNLLARIEDMRVIARTSSFAFKGQDKPISEIGAALGVSYILEGSVRKSGNRVRITAQLIETRESFHLWSETWDRTLDDIFAIQDEISAAIVKSLTSLILPDLPSSTVAASTSVEAWEDYLLGQQLMQKRTGEDMAQGRTRLQRCVEKEPEYQPGLIALADAHLLMSNGPGCFGSEPVEGARMKAGPLLEEARAVGDESDYLCTVLSFYFRLDGNLDLARSWAERALEQTPNNARALLSLSSMADPEEGPYERVLPALQKVLEVDPLSVLCLSNLGSRLCMRTRFEEARGTYEKIRALEPQSPFASRGELLIANFEGRLADVLGCFADHPDLIDNRLARLHLLRTLTLLGEGPKLEHVHPAYALYFYEIFGQHTDADRLAEGLKTRERPHGPFGEPDLGLPLWHLRHGRGGEARDLLLRHDDRTSPWGPLVGLTANLAGGRIAWSILSTLGETNYAAEMAGKLRCGSEILLDDPEGAHYAAHHVAAVAAMTEGCTDDALSHAEQFADTTSCYALQLANDPALAPLRDTPRFQDVLNRVKDHIAAEKADAAERGLLPFPDELIQRTR